MHRTSLESLPARETVTPYARDLKTGVFYLSMARTSAKLDRQVRSQLLFRSNEMRKILPGPSSNPKAAGREAQTLPLKYPTPQQIGVSFTLYTQPAHR